MKCSLIVSRTGEEAERCLHNILSSANEISEKKLRVNQRNKVIFTDGTEIESVVLRPYTFRGKSLDFILLNGIDITEIEKVSALAALRSRSGQILKLW